MHRILVVSCLFTSDDIFGIYSAPTANYFRCIFFTNREDIATRAELLGWEPCKVPFPLCTDPLELSLQSKAVKFLSFWGDPFFSRIWDIGHCSVLYFDHKFNVSAEHVERIVCRAGDANIMLRGTPRMKMSIWDEVVDALHQERYSRHMEQTCDYLEKVIADGVAEEVRICNTGLMYFGNPGAILDLTRKVFNACILLKQPECQIFWALFSQEYAANIRVIDWLDPAVADIPWREPTPI